MKSQINIKFKKIVDAQCKYPFSPKGWNVSHENYFHFVIDIPKVALVYKKIYIFFSYNRLPKIFLDNFATTCMY